MSLSEMLQFMKPTTYSDYYMNVAAAIDMYNSVKSYEFVDDLKIVATYYSIDPTLIKMHAGMSCPFSDDSYVSLVEIIRAYTDGVNVSDFCIRSSYWIGHERKAAAMLENMKTLPGHVFKFTPTRNIWRSRSWKDILFNLFD